VEEREELSSASPRELRRDEDTTPFHKWSVDDVEGLAASCAAADVGCEGRE
jgi:hypothetical protein